MQNKIENSGFLKYHETVDGWDDSFSLVDGCDDPERIGWMPLVLDSFKKMAGKRVLITVQELDENWKPLDPDR